MATPKPDYSEAIKFLQRWNPQGPWIVTAIDPLKKGIETASFAAGDHEACREWMEEQGTRLKRNIYFTVNAVTRMIDTKPSREHIAGMTWLHVDLDPDAPPEGADRSEIDAHYTAERERILALLRTPPAPIPPPTCITFSGGGYQGFWRLERPLLLDGTPEQYEEAKRYNKQLEIVLGGDNCHNVDRIMRVPGSINRPDARKRKKGRREARADVVEWSDASYTLDQFTKAEVTTSRLKGSVVTFEPPTDVRRFASVDDIPELADADQCRVVIACGNDPDSPGKFGDSRSEWLFFAVCEMVRQGMTDDAIYSVITDPAFEISASVLDKGSGTDRYAARQIERARDVAEDFTKNKDGKVLPTQKNVRRALAKLGVALEFDEFAERMYVSGLDRFGPHLDDAAVNRMWLGVEERFGLSVGKDRFLAIVQDIAMLNRRHPVREFLDALSWDGEPRLDRWLTTYVGAEESDYTRAVGTIVLVAAVRRIHEPGCKFDEMLVLEGPQGSDKSSALRVLAVRPEWFTDDLTLNAKAQEFIEQTLGKWIVEAGELKGMRKGEVEVLKATLSRQRDRARMAYGRLPLERLRQFVMFGTTNADKYLKDSTGNRRFWPVKTGAVNLDALRRDRKQLWAEAVAREAAGESIRLAPSLYASAAREQEERRAEEPWVQVLGEALHGIEGKLRTEDAWRIVGVASERREQIHCERLGTSMRELGWERKQRRFGGDPEWAYVKGNARIRLEVGFDNQGRPVAREAGAMSDDERADNETFGGGKTT